MDLLKTRPHYRPSGRIAGSRFLIAALGLAATGLAGGVLLEILTVHVFYVGLFYALGGGLVLGGATFLAVRFGHCRNRVIGSAMGIFAGAVAFASFFHFDQCWRWNEPWNAFENLPHYIDFRMQTDELIGHGKGYEVRPAPGGQVAMLQLPGEQRLNWLNFAVETGLFVLLPMSFGFRTAGTPFTEKYQRWLECARLVCPPEMIPELLEALRRGRIGEWVKRPQILLAPDAHHGKISVWYCPAKPDEEPEWLAYLNVGDLKHLRLEPEEAAALLPIFPGLLEMAVPEVGRRSVPAPASSDRSMARIWPIPEPHAGRLLTPFNAVVINVLVLAYHFIPLILMFVHIGIVGVLARFVGNGIDGVALVVWAVGGIFLPLLLMRRLYRSHAKFPVNSRYYRWLFRRHLADRPEPLVTFADPHAVFVEVIPRKNWAKVVLESAADMGLLVVDPERREVRFEGDRERWLAPAEAIVHCTIELMPSPISNDGKYMVMLRVRLADGEWEWPLIPRAGIAGADHSEQAQVLCEKIAVLLLPEESSIDVTERGL